MQSFFFFFNDTASTEIYTLSLHDALPIFPGPDERQRGWRGRPHATCGRACPRPRYRAERRGRRRRIRRTGRSEEHTSELQSHVNLVCRLLLEKKKKKKTRHMPEATRRQTG